MPNLSIPNVIASLRRWANVNEEMGRVVVGQVELMRDLADNMIVGQQPAAGIADALDALAADVSAGKKVDPSELAALMESAAASLRFGRDAVIEDVAIRARLGKLGDSASSDEVYDNLMALRSAGALPAEGVPRPITEAPQDGTPIVAVIDGKPAVIRFFEPWGNWQHSSVDFSTIDAEKDEYFGIGYLVPTAWIDVPRRLLEAEYVVAPEPGVTHGVH